VPGYDGGFGDCTGFYFEEPRPPILYSVRAACSTGDYGDLFQLLKNFLKLTIYTDWYQSGSPEKINFCDREKP